jgi:ribosome-associated protein
MAKKAAKKQQARRPGKKPAPKAHAKAKPGKGKPSKAPAGKAPARGGRLARPSGKPLRAPAKAPRIGKEAALAPPAAPPPRRPPNDEAHAAALAIAHAGLDKKAEDVVVLDVRGLTGYADYFVIMTADSDRQASAIADNLDQKMKEAGVGKVGSEGYETGRWILVDYGDVVAHVMSPDSRALYDLEGLWADAPRLRVEG